MRVALVLSALLVIAPTASAGLLGGLLGGEPGEVLVGYREGALRDATSLVLGLGGTVLGTNEDLRYLVVGTRSLTQFLATVALSPLVEYAERNDATRQTGVQWNGAEWNGAQWNGAEWNGAEWNGAQWNSAGVPSDPGFSTQWGLHAIRAPDAWNVSIGTRATRLCILDSGVAWDHPDLAANVGVEIDGTRGFNAIDPRLTAYDDGGHGTHMAGIASAAIGNGVGVAGVGNLTILPVKVLTANGTGKEDDLAAGLVWCAQHDADVALMALSVDDEGPTVRNALSYAASRDVLLVASAGNNGPCSNCVAYPARDSRVVAVSALAEDGTLASFSGQGPQVDLAAPGVGIVSTFLGNGYASGSGTSQAAAFVAGSAALLRDIAPTLSASATRTVLETGATDLGSLGKDARTGHGLVDLAVALGGGS